MSFESFMDVHFPEDAGNPEVKAHSAVVCLATPGVPVIYVSDAFEAHTGYRPDEAIGRGLSFLQGPESEASAVAEFRRLISNRVAGKVRITNYRKDGTRFVHECELRPVCNDTDEVTHFIAIQRPV